MFLTLGLIYWLSWEIIWMDRRQELSQAGAFSLDTLLLSRVAFFSSKSEHHHFNPYRLLAKYSLAAWTYKDTLA